MRKVYLNLTLLIIGLAALIGGSSLLPTLNADTRAVDIGVDLSGCYVIEVNPQQIASVTYNTNSQSGVRMQYGDLDATRRIYYVSASDEPTSVTINPLIEQGANYGIRSITDASGKMYSTAPRRTVIKTSDLTVGNLINVNTDLLSNITTGKLIINYHNPEGLSTDNINVTSTVGYHYNLNYKFSDFKNNSIEIPYDPETETVWYLQNSQKMFVARLDGTKKITRTMVLMAANSNNGQNYAFSVDLKDNPQGTHTLDVYASVIPMNVPMRFEFENSTGNEKNPDYLSGMIESITINGTTLTDKSWLEPGFTVPNGAKLTVGIKKQVRNIWEFEKAWFNGTICSHRHPHAI